nr:MAG TPA: transcriptional activator [Caudoviricetes sp.]DAT80001.1 MAG TPA: transcriptional activator [Caudoviricetes sp.]
MATQEQKIIFRKIEDVLYSYKKYVDKIKDDLKELENPQITKSYSISKLTGSGYVMVKSELERIEELKERLLNDIARHEEILFRIDNALKMVEDHKDYSFIEMRYFNKLTYEEIADKIGVEVRTTYRIRNNILSALEIHFKTQKLL